LFKILKEKHSKRIGVLREWVEGVLRPSNAKKVKNGWYSCFACPS